MLDETTALFSLLLRFRKRLKSHVSMCVFPFEKIFSAPLKKQTGKKSADP